MINVIILQTVKSTKLLGLLPKQMVDTGQYLKRVTKLLNIWLQMCTSKADLIDYIKFRRQKFYYKCYSTS